MVRILWELARELKRCVRVACWISCIPKALACIMRTYPRGLVAPWWLGFGRRVGLFLFLCVFLWRELNNGPHFSRNQKLSIPLLLTVLWMASLWRVRWGCWKHLWGVLWVDNETCERDKYACVKLHIIVSFLVTKQYKILTIFFKRFAIIACYT